MLGDFDQPELDHELLEGLELGLLLADLPLELRVLDGELVQLFVDQLLLVLLLVAERDKRSKIGHSRQQDLHLSRNKLEASIDLKFELLLFVICGLS